MSNVKFTAQLNFEGNIVRWRKLVSMKAMAYQRNMATAISSPKKHFYKPKPIPISSILMPDLEKR